MTGDRRGRRWRGGLRRRGEVGAQSLEWIALGSVILAALAAASRYAAGAGNQIGQVFVDHLKGLVGQ
jgi:hypothetical protein